MKVPFTTKATLRTVVDGFQMTVQANPRWHRKKSNPSGKNNVTAKTMFCF